MRRAASGALKPDGPIYVATNAAGLSVGRGSSLIAWITSSWQEVNTWEFKSRSGDQDRSECRCHPRRGRKRFGRCARCTRRVRSVNSLDRLGVAVVS